MSTRWDTYFMTLCEAVASNCKCPSRQLGAIIVRDRHVLSTGYNGPPSGFPHPGTPRFMELAANVAGKTVNEIWSRMGTSLCPRKAMGIESGKQLGFCPCAHSERNAIDAAAKMGTSTDGATMYLNNYPCLDCSYSIVGAGIVEVVVEKNEPYIQPGFTGERILLECGIQVREAEHD